MADQDQVPPARGDEAELFREFSADFMRSVGGAVFTTTPNTIVWDDLSAPAQRHMCHPLTPRKHNATVFYKLQEELVLDGIIAAARQPGDGDCNDRGTFDSRMKTIKNATISPGTFMPAPQSGDLAVTFREHIANALETVLREIQLALLSLSGGCALSAPRTAPVHHIATGSAPRRRRAGRSDGHQRGETTPPAWRSDGC